MAKQVWKVGELAKQTGITVRTLRYYDQLGILKPSEYTETGHRLYTEQDIFKLQQILSSRHLGLPLEEIKHLLESPTFVPLEIVRMHRERVEEQIQVQQELHEQLAGFNYIIVLAYVFSFSIRISERALPLQAVAKWVVNFSSA